MSTMAPRNPAGTGRRRVTEIPDYPASSAWRSFSIRARFTPKSYMACQVRAAERTWITFSSSAQAAFQVIDIAAPAAALRMDIIIRCGDDDGSLSMLQQVLQSLESGGRVSRDREWIDTVIKCRIIPGYRRR